MANSKKLSILSLSLIVGLCLLPFGCKSADSANTYNRFQAESQSTPRLENSNDNARQQASLNRASPFIPILPSLKAKTKVPLRLPDYLATESESHSLYAIIEYASPSAYELQLAFTQDCSGGNVCHYGMVSGFRIKAREANPKGKSVLLWNGIKGYFLKPS